MTIKHLKKLERNSNFEHFLNNTRKFCLLLIIFYCSYIKWQTIFMYLVIRENRNGFLSITRLKQRYFYYIEK